MSAIELDDGTPAWRSWATMRLAMIRGGLFAIAVALATLRPSLIVVAWVPFLLALIEAWAAARERARRFVVLVMVAVFVIGSVGLVAAYFQTIYVSELFETRSFARALRKLAEAPRNVVRGSEDFCILLVLAAESLALAFAASIALRIRKRRLDVAIGVFVIIIVFPPLDWIVFSLLQHEHGARIIWAAIAPGWIFSSVTLAIGGCAALAGVEGLRVLARVIDRRLAAPESAA